MRNIGDIFLEYVQQFTPFIKYGAKQLFGKFEFEREKTSNHLFQRFVDETERLKESRKLELNGYLTKPTTRLARYPLLLENVLKRTAEDSPDKQDIPKAIAMIRDVLAQVNEDLVKLKTTSLDESEPTAKVGRYPTHGLEAHGREPPVDLQEHFEEDPNIGNSRHHGVPL